MKHPELADIIARTLIGQSDLRVRYASMTAGDTSRALLRMTPNANAADNVDGASQDVEPKAIAQACQELAKALLATAERVYPK